MIEVNFSLKKETSDYVFKFFCVLMMMMLVVVMMLMMMVGFQVRAVRSIDAGEELQVRFCLKFQSRICF